jgi:transglutaminase-like putative cysteine protease
VSLYPIFIGTTWFWAGCASALVVALTGTLTRLRRLPVLVTLPCYAAALLLWLNLAFANARSLWHLLPTPGSFAALFNAAGQGFTDASKYAPAVPELRGMVLLAAAGIGIAAVATDLIAVRLGNAALAGLPLLLLFTEPFTLSVHRGWVGTTFAFCAGVAGYLALLSSEGKDRIREWDSQDDAEWRKPDTQPLAAAGRRVGFASVALALCLPLFVPGLHATRLFGGQLGIGGNGGGGGGGAGFPDPNTQLTNELTKGRQENVLSYVTSATVPGYLQIYTLDKLTDTAGWTMNAQPANLVTGGQALPPAPGVNPASPSVHRVTTQVAVAQDVGADEGGALPVPYPATSITAPGTVKADRNTGMVYDAGASLGGLQYTVGSFDVEPSYAALQKALPPPASSSAYLDVPSAYDGLKPLASSVAKGAASQFIAAIDLQDWLSDTGPSNGNFGYTLHAASIVNAAGLTNFLEHTRAGYCMQFAYAMAVLARLLGIPSRVAVGFTGGTANSAGQYVVTTHDAHAWPELYFSGYGWLRFEPTPAGNAVGQGTAFAPAYTSDFSIGPGTDQPQENPSAGPSSGAAINTHLNDQAPLSAYGQTPGSAQVSPWVIVGLAVAFLFVIAAAAPWCARRVVRRRRWARWARKGKKAAIPAQHADRVRARDIAWAHAAWAELRDDLADHGAPSLSSDSPRAVAARAGTGLLLGAPARDALGRIAMAQERASYAPAPSDGSGLHADSLTVRRAIATAVPRGTRWRARLFPASVIRPAYTGLLSLTDIYRGPAAGRQRTGQ